MPIRMFNSAGSIFACAGALDFDLDAERLLEIAIARARLDDFGAPDFLKPYNILVRAYREEARLHAFGRLAARSDLLRLLSNRLALEAEWRARPQLSAEVIDRPIFIVGMPRTGTTFLHTLLAQDPRFRVVRTWEAMYPIPAPHADAYETDRRIGRAARALSIFRRLVPGIDAVHPLGAVLPQECMALMSHAFASPQFPTTHDVPSYQSWVDGDDLADGYRYHRRILQGLQRARPAGRWVLKSPAHLAKLDTLFDVYPNARIIQCHRDPCRSVPSLANLKATLAGAFSDRVDPRAIGQSVARRWTRILGEAMRFRARRDDLSGRFFDLAYADLVRDPVDALTSVYRALGVEFGEGDASRVRLFAERRRLDRRMPPTYSLSAFGLEEGTLRAAFQQYCQRYAVVEEAATA